MIKKTFAIIVIALAVCSVHAQNIQLHYDFGRSRDGKTENKDGFLTSTIEMFRPDKWGSTFFFVDMNYNAPKGGVSLAYWEIARDFKISDKFPVMPHIEYNGGFATNYSKNAQGDYEAVGGGISFRNAWLFGASYPFSLGKGSFSTYVAYKYIVKNTQPDFQWTATWFYPLFDNKVTLCGFIDVWTDDKNTKGDKKIVFLTEPQFWFNATPNFSVGSEIEISKNFVFGSDKVEVFPTAAVKWTF